jgi:hypothetical protein
MACVRLYRYAQIFKDEQINGKDIKDMDPDILKVKYFNTPLKKRERGVVFRPSIKHISIHSFAC